MSTMSDLDLAMQDYCIYLQKSLLARFPGSNTEYVYEAGTKYIKIISQTVHGSQMSSHSFVVIGDQGKFKHGDILKSASWKAPAKNFARGNVLTGNYEHISPFGA